MGAPPPDRLAADHDTALKHHLFDLMEAERGPKVQPHAVIDDFGRVPVVLVRQYCGARPIDSPSYCKSNNETVSS